MKRLDGLRLIALFKLAKAVLLGFSAYGAKLLSNPQVIDRLHDWADTLGDRPERVLVERALAWVDGLGVSALHSVVVVTGLYICLLLVEGLGLWFRKTWAEWFTVIATSSLIPFELYKLLFQDHGHRLLLFGVLVVNCAIVAFLIWQLRRSRRHAA
jgi:uncharacterized membrane protein (DUF2068 family)